VSDDLKGAYARLLTVDPKSARQIEPKDGVRIARALEVFEATGRPLSVWHQDPHPPLLAAGTWEGVALMPQREVLYQRIESRFEQMMEDGALNEAHALYQRGLDPV
jgi:tRNA dimethylallyltransferase